MRIVTHNVTKKSITACKAILEAAWVSGFSKFAVLPGGGGEMPMGLLDVAMKA